MKKSAIRRAVATAFVLATIASLIAGCHSPGGGEETTPAWQVVGTADFSAGEVYTTSLAIDSSGTPYVAYQDVENSYKATVMRFK